MRTLSKPLSVLVALGVAGCASSGSSANTGTMAAADPAPTPAAEAPAPAAAAPTEAAAGSAHFTKVQADAGRDTFRALCTECHYSGEFSDAQFKFKWSRRNAMHLYELIYNQMPESAPGSLSTDEAVGLTAYILRMNGFEEGATELSSDPDALAAISLRSIRD